MAHRPMSHNQKVQSKMMQVRSDRFLDYVVVGVTWSTHCVTANARLSSAHLARVGLSILVHSFKLSAQHFACRPRFLPTSSVPCSTAFVRRLWRVMSRGQTMLAFFFALHLSLSCGPTLAFIALCTNSLNSVLWSFHEIPNMHL